MLAWAFVRLGRRRAARGVGGLGGDRARPLRRGLALALVRHRRAGWRAYLGTGVERVAIRVLYFGQVYADRDVPWHYPWFYFAVDRAGRPARSWASSGLVAGLAATAGPTRSRSCWPGRSRCSWSLFSTRVPVYDGERLFLLVFPLWAILIGRGFAAAWDAAPRAGVGRGLARRRSCSRRVTAWSRSTRSG